jgi:5-methylcytosine-specific restriction endonuclease McrA
MLLSWQTFDFEVFLAVWPGACQETGFLLYLIHTFALSWYYHVKHLIQKSFFFGGGGGHQKLENGNKLVICCEQCHTFDKRCQYHIKSF